MAEISDVYGSDFQNEAKKAKVGHQVNTIANNLAHRQMNFRLFDSLDLWDSSHRIPPTVIQTIIQKIQSINPKLHVIALDKQSEQINLLPSLIIDTPVEYLWMIDAEYHRSYFVYLTPYEVNAF